MKATNKASLTLKPSTLEQWSNDPTIQLIPINEYLAVVQEMDEDDKRWYDLDVICPDGRRYYLDVDAQVESEIREAIEFHEQFGFFDKMIISIQL